MGPVQPLDEKKKEELQEDRCTLWSRLWCCSSEVEKGRSKEQILHEKADKVNSLNPKPGGSSRDVWRLETTNRGE